MLFSKAPLAASINKQCSLESVMKTTSSSRRFFVNSLKVCARKKDLQQGSRIHADIRNSGLLAKDPCLGNMLVSMYAKCGALVRAKKTLDELSSRNAVAWSSLIVGYAQQGRGLEALDCYHKMLREDLCPDAITYSCTLKACGITRDIELGNKIHGEIASRRLLAHDIVLGTALIDMYAKCGAIVKAQRVFDELSTRDVASWSALIAGYARHGHGQEALECFHRMQKEGLAPDAITYVCILKACSITKDIDMGKRIHDHVISRGLLRNNIMLGTALIDMYSKCGALLKAQNTHYLLYARSVASWNALITGYIYNRHGYKALICFQQMKREEITPDAITYACVLKACGITQDMGMGRKMHDDIIRKGLLNKRIELGTILVDMYVKCGVLMNAQNAFDELPARSVASWNALIAGYAQQGQHQETMGCFCQMQCDGFSPNLISWNALIGGYAHQGLAEEALECFKSMQQEGASPDAITCINVLNACSHSGLVDDGQMFFDSMSKKCGITPCEEHYACMVDLFGRSRLFNEAMRVIKMMPLPDCLAVWLSLLGACRKWANVKLGRMAFEFVVQLSGCNAAAYVLMSDIYAAAGMHEEATKIECMRIEIASG